MRRFDAVTMSDEQSCGMLQPVPQPPFGNIMVAFGQVVQVVTVLPQPDADDLDAFFADLRLALDLGVIEPGDFFRREFLAPEQAAEDIALHGAELGR